MVMETTTSAQSVGRETTSTTSINYSKSFVDNKPYITNVYYPPPLQQQRQQQVPSVIPTYKKIDNFQENIAVKKSQLRHNSVITNIQPIKLMPYAGMISGNSLQQSY
ncbi:hypothetical protein HCN44_000837 [Aphidius gifuensis]|uniref:Uncharacterized protein n=1 Tax=Aphidius gifuensis TaxID=684658 RepID=A0A834XR63_APHGI|nr:hypothetical protein HCN44_000837 [Aphidius gifuensis]